MTMSSIKQKGAVQQSFELLIKCMLQAKHRLIELGSEIELTGMQAMMMLLLEEPKPMNSFTKVFSCDASNVTGIVDGLEQKGLAARFPAKNDRRVKMIKLSERGKALRAQLLDKLIESQGSVLFKLSPAELTTLTVLLKKITVNGS